MRRPLVTLLLTATLAGCGGSTGKTADPVERVPESARADVKSAQEVDVSAFPAAADQGLDQIAAQFDTAGPQAALATSVFRVGENRLAFGILDENVKFVYGDTVVYLAGPSSDKVTGPFAAPADVLVTEPRYRSAQAAKETDPFAAVYSAEVSFNAPGVWQALVVTDAGGGKKTAAALDFEVTTAKGDPIPDVGEMAPRVATDTLESVGGVAELLDTRVPPADALHETSFSSALGKKPVALLFATPQLCQSRVCGPVVDEMLELQAKYGEQMTFIHQEVFVENVVEKGLRAPLAAFKLQTEPWLFTVDAKGRVAARLEGSFGLREFEDAVRAAL